MKNRMRFLQHVTERSYLYIEGIIAAVLVIGGINLLALSGEVAPAPDGASAIVQYIRSTPVVVSLGVLFLLPGLLLFLGIFTNKQALRSVGLFFGFLVLLWISILIIVDGGITDLSWLTPLALGLIAAIVRMRISWERDIR